MKIWENKEKGLARVSTTPLSDLLLVVTYRGYAQVPVLNISKPLIRSSTFQNLQSIMSAQSETDQSKFAKIFINVDLANSEHLLVNPR